MVGYDILEARSRRPLARRIAERVGVVEPHRLDERQCLLEVLLRLAREPDDDVGREGDAGNGPAQRRDHLQVAVAIVAPQHPLEHARAAALHRQVHVLADRGRLGHGAEHAVAEVGGVGRGEAQPRQARHVADRAQQVGEVVLAVPVAVDRLAKERDLRRAARREALDLAHHVVQLAAPLRATRHRNDAEGAPIIAATLDRHERRHGGLARRWDVLVVLPRLELDRGSAFAPAGPGDELGQPAVAIGPDDQVHLRHASEQPLPEALRHAADHAEHVARSLVLLQLAEAREHALLGVIAHGAGVHKQHVCLRGVVGADIPLPTQDAEHQLGVRHVHLAAVGLDVDARHG